MLSVAVIVLLVLMALCAVVGAIYAYLYFTRINPAAIRGHRGLGFGAAAGNTGSACCGAGTGGGGGGGSEPHGRRASTLGDDDQPAVSPSTHMFLFRKP